MQQEIRLLGEMGDNYFEVAFTSAIDLEEFARVNVPQLPRLDAIVAWTARRLVVQDKQVCIDEWIQWLRLVL